MTDQDAPRGYRSAIGLDDPYAPGGRLHWIAEAKKRRISRSSRPVVVAKNRLGRPPLPPELRKIRRYVPRPAIPGLSPKAAAERIGSTEHMIRRACVLGLLKFTKIERPNAARPCNRWRIRILEADLDEWKDRSAILTPEQAGKLVGASRNTVRSWIAAGLPVVQYGEGVRLREDVVREWVAANRPDFGKKRHVYRKFFRPDDPAKGGIIYGLTDPRSEYKKSPVRYIGQTSNLDKRRNNYKNHFERGDAHSPALQRWFGKLKRLGLTFGMVQLDQTLFGIGELERRWIREGKDKGWKLLNCTIGGEGGNFTEEVKARLSEKTKLLFSDPAYVARWKAAYAKRLGMSVEEWDAKREQAKLAKEERRRQPRQIVKPSFDVSPPIAVTYKGVAFIPLKGGGRAKVDAVDADRVMAERWQGQSHRTKVRAKSSSKGLLSRFIVGAGQHEAVKHSNGNSLDCRRANLVVREAYIHMEGLRFFAGGPVLGAVRRPQELSHGRH